MEIFEPMKSLLCEAFSFRKYKALPLPLAILVGIFLLPVWITSLVYAGVFFVCGVFVTLVEYPVEALLSFVRREAKEVNEITQVFVYIIGFPVVVCFKVFAVLFTIFNHVLYFLTTIGLYIATLCGIKFDLSMKVIERSKEAEPKSFGASIKAIIFLALVALIFVFGFIGFILFLIGTLAGVPALVTVGLILFMTCGGFYTLGLIWIVLAFGTDIFKFKKREKKPVEEENEIAVEKPSEEAVAQEAAFERNKDLRDDLLEETFEKVPEEPIEEEAKEEEPLKEKVEEEPEQEMAELAPEEETVHEEEYHEEPAPEEGFELEEPQEEEHKEEQPVQEEQHFDFSSLEDYEKNRRPSDDYQAERLDDLEDDYDRR